MNDPLLQKLHEIKKIGKVLLGSDRFLYDSFFCYWKKIPNFCTARSVPQMQGTPDGDRGHCPYMMMTSYTEGYWCLEGLKKKVIGKLPYPNVPQSLRLLRKYKEFGLKHGIIYTTRYNHEGDMEIQVNGEWKVLA